MTAQRQLSILSPLSYSSSSCGYCNPSVSGQRSPKKTKSYGVWTHRLSPFHYQQLIDLGWRRSGDYVYKPDNSRNCCQQVPIRLRAGEFRAGKGQKRAMSNLLFEVRTKQKPAKWKGKWSKERDWDAEKKWSECEWSGEEKGWANKIAGPKIRKLELTLSPSSSTQEKYHLFRRYQAKVHGESDDKISPSKGWERFLVDTCMTPTLPSSGKPLSEDEELRWRGQTIDPDDHNQEVPYGCYHHEYRLDGKLIAVGVLDILPKCVSSVYVFYDPDMTEFEIGKVSALREIALVQQLGRKKGMQNLQYYYLGFYIHTCQKMRYKAQYRPCELLDCATNNWVPYAQVEAALDQGVRYNFERPALPSSNLKVNHTDVEMQDEEEEEFIPTLPAPPPGMRDSSKLLKSLRGATSISGPELELLSKVTVLEAEKQYDGIKPLLMSSFAKAFAEDGESKDFLQCIDCVAALNDETLVSQCVLFV